MDKTVESQNRIMMQNVHCSSEGKVSLLRFASFSFAFQVRGSSVGGSQGLQIETPTSKALPHCFNLKRTFESLDATENQDGAESA